LRSFPFPSSLSFFLYFITFRLSLLHTLFYTPEWALYEQLSQLSINVEEYQAKKREIYRSFDRLEHLKSMLAAQAEQVQMNEKAKTAKIKAAHETVNANGLTADLCNALIERVYIYPDNRISVIWKIKDFCTNEMLCVKSVSFVVGHAVTAFKECSNPQPNWLGV